MAKRNPGIPGPKHLSQTVRFVTTCRPNWHFLPAPMTLNLGARLTVHLAMVRGPKLFREAYKRGGLAVVRGDG